MKEQTISFVAQRPRTVLLLIMMVLFLTIGAVGEVAAAPYDTGVDAFCDSGAPDWLKDAGDYCNG